MCIATAAGVGESAPSGAGRAVGIFPGRDHGVVRQAQPGTYQAGTQPMAQRVEQTSYQIAPQQDVLHTVQQSSYATPGQPIYH